MPASLKSQITAFMQYLVGNSICGAMHDISNKIGAIKIFSSLDAQVYSFV